MSEVGGRRLVDVFGLAAVLRQIAAERDWEKFHTPRNLAMALAGEVGELLAEMQWQSDAEILGSPSGDLRRRISAEIADVMIYLARLSDVLAVDLDGAVREKLDEVTARYRVEDIRGSSEKR